MNLNTLPYDILDNVINYLDINSTINLLLVSKNIYNNYRYNKHYEIVMINKMMNYFPSLSRLKIDYKTMDNDKIDDKIDDKIYDIYNCLNNIYYYFNKHRDTSLSDILIYLCDIKKSDRWIFKFIISHCYFTRNGDHVYNAIRADDLIYLLMYSENISIITKYIVVDAIILLNVIRYKINAKNKKDVLLLVNYLLFKHFFRTSEYIEDVITDIVCEVIKINDLSMLDEIFKKQTFYKFRLNYQKIITSCIEQRNIDCFNLINIKYKEQIQYLKERNQAIRLVMITKESVRYLMKKKSYNMLSLVIELYLKELINMNGYINEIVNNFDYNDDSCIRLIQFFNDRNKRKLKIQHF